MVASSEGGLALEMKVVVIAVAAAEVMASTVAAATEKAVVLVVARKVAAAKSPGAAQAVRAAVGQTVAKQVATKEAELGSVTMGAVQVARAEMWEVSAVEKLDLAVAAAVVVLVATAVTMEAVVGSVERVEAAAMAAQMEVD